MSTELFNLENDDYMWLHILHGEANAQSIKRDRLNEWALKYGLEPSKYKNLPKVAESSINCPSYHSPFE